MSELGCSAVIGGALILAGTAIGAGMLALPLVSGEAGLVPTIILFLVTAAVAVMSALYTFEANVAIRPGCDLFTMAEHTLGRVGKWLAALAPLGLFYALMAAYFSAGGSLLGQYLQAVQVPPRLCIIIFAMFAATFVYCSTRAVDRVNRIIFSLMIVAFIMALLFLAPAVRYENLIHTAKIEYVSIFAALPVIFTSFGFHGGIPSIIIYQKKQFKYVPLIFLFATLVPLAVYAAWLFVVMGIVPEASLQQINQSADATAHLISTVSREGRLRAILHLFSDLALLSSVLGVALGLFDYLASFMRRQNTRMHRMQTALVTFTPPVAIAILFPDGFVAALGYAAIALAILAIMLPVAMVYVLRCQSDYSPSFKTPGGSITMALCFLFGCLVIFSNFLAT